MTITTPRFAFGKHQIYRYNGNWYSICGLCARSLMGANWDIATGLLRLHIERHEVVDNLIPSG